jgi:hypothetical protein
MECINATSLHRKSGQWGTQRSLPVKQPQVPPLRFAPVGMTKFKLVPQFRFCDWDGKIPAFLRRE